MPLFQTIDDLKSLKASRHALKQLVSVASQVTAKSQVVFLYRSPFSVSCYSIGHLSYSQNDANTIERLAASCEELTSALSDSQAQCDQTTQRSVQLESHLDSVSR
jgi:prefoldin subunit 5